MHIAVFEGDDICLPVSVDVGEHAGQFEPTPGGFVVTIGTECFDRDVKVVAFGEAEVGAVFAKAYDIHLAISVDVGDLAGMLAEHPGGSCGLGKGAGPCFQRPKGGSGLGF